MIVQPARIAVIDNNEHHLKALVDALSGMGSGCLSFHYNEDHPRPEMLTGVRFIFSDLHLISDAVTSDKKQQYSNIASMLYAGLGENHGPYVLVIWSEFPDELEALKEYLKQLGPNQAPIRCCVLNKHDYLPSDGAPKTQELIEAIKSLLADVPGVLALLDWEQKVATAAALSTSTLWRLAQGSDEQERDNSLRNVLGRLSKGAIGEKAAEENPGRGVIEALTPLLADQLEKSEVHDALWKEAVDFSRPEIASSGPELYGMLYFECPTRHNPLERGTVSELPDEWSTDDKFGAKFGFSKQQLLEEFGYKTSQLEDVHKRTAWYLIQVNAACDQAQGNAGLVPFALAALAPCLKKNSAKGSVWSSRAVLLDGEEKVLLVHGRFVIGLTANEAEKFKVKMRVRTQLLDLMVQEIRSKAARLGAIEPH